MPRKDAEPLHEVGEAVGERTGLSAARPRDDAHEALGRLDRPPLLVVEPVQDAVAAHGGGSPLRWRRRVPCRTA